MNEQIHCLFNPILRLAGERGGRVKSQITVSLLELSVIQSAREAF